MPRSAGYRHHEDTRKKIQAALIINRLHDHVMSDAPVMDSSQVNAAKTLLNKVLPDLSAVSHDGTLTHEAGDSIKALMDAVNGRTRSK